MADHTKRQLLSTRNKPGGTFEWLTEKGYIINKNKTDSNSEDEKPNRIASHRFINGLGNVCLPLEESSTFFQKLAADLRKECALSISEMATAPVYRAFCDIDTVEMEAPNKEYSLKIAKIAQRTMAKFLHEKRDYPVIVSLCKFSEQVTSPEYTYTLYKYGIHLVFYTVFVNHNMMNHFDSMFMEDLYTSLGTRMPGTKAAKLMVDPAVHNGPEDTKLRMNGCPKVEECIACSNRRKTHVESSKNYVKQTCTVCFGSSRMVFASQYRARYVLNDDGSLNNDLLSEMKSDLAFELSLTSIRARDENQRARRDFRIPLNAPAPVSLKYFQKMSSVHPSSITYGETEHASFLKPLQREQKEDVDDVSIRQQMTHFINFQTGVDSWKDLEISRMSKCMSENNNTYYIIRVSGAGKRHCLNVVPDASGHRLHSKSAIYFFLSSKGLFQKCHSSNQKQLSTADERRVNGRCKTFLSNPMPLPVSLSRLLFPTSLSTLSSIMRLPLLETNGHVGTNSSSSSSIELRHAGDIYSAGLTSSSKFHSHSRSDSISLSALPWSAEYF
jgi:hypothetical protein